MCPAPTSVEVLCSAGLRLPPSLSLPSALSSVPAPVPVSAPVGRRGTSFFPHNSLEEQRDLYQLLSDQVSSWKQHLIDALPEPTLDVLLPSTSQIQPILSSCKT